MNDVKTSLEGMRDKSIPTTIPCPDSKPSNQRARAALTVYIIVRRRMAMDSLEGIRDKSIPTTIPCPDSKPSFQWARGTLTIYILNRDRWQWTASKD